MDDVELGRIPAQRELPEPVKFAWPIMLLPEMFATPRHLALVLGYLASIGWEVFVPDLRAVYGKGPTPPLEKLRFNDLAALAGEALEGIGREAVIFGHGVGGLIALKLSAHPRVKASVAYAPLVPGFRTPIVGGIGNRIATMLGRPIKPPSGRVLFELIADSDPFTREGLINAMVPDSGALATDVMTGAIEFARIGQSRAAARRRRGLGYSRADAGDDEICRVDRREAGDDSRAWALADWRTRARTCNQ